MWVDLTHPLSEEMPRLSIFPTPLISAYRSMPADPMNVTSLEMVCHVGTHLDAPRHFLPYGETIEELALDRLTGAGIVCRISPSARDEIGVGDLEDADRIRPGDIVFLHTGWAVKFGTPAYLDHPALSLELAHWLVARGVGLVAVDMPTPDLAVHRRDIDFAWPIHHVLLSAGVLIVEHVADLAALSGSRVEAIVASLPLVGADGAPARVLARRTP